MKMQKQFKMRKYNNFEFFDLINNNFKKTHHEHLKNYLCKQNVAPVHLKSSKSKHDSEVQN